MVFLSRIYTKSGDRGETGLGDGTRVPKDSPRVAAYGEVDELNAVLGLAAANCPDCPEAALLRGIQNDLFDVGADLSVPYGVTDRLRVEQAAVDRLEQLCDELNEALPMLKSFVLPGGTESAARLHVARAICRRAEREALAANEEHGINLLVLKYLNRLSDFLFIAARSANASAGRDEPLWKPGG